MKQYFAYTRVSTVKQGEQGVSLQEQKSEIERYARQKNLAISEWFEERETAAKTGRTLFTQLMKRLRKGDAAGVIIHKIDRSARNLRDWVEIGQLTDDGIEVHFTREALDLQSSSGRLSADVQAVVAANYIRNLREETIKGIYGRLKQGIYPFMAPLGYLDAGRGKPKTIDPMRGPLIKQAFDLYATQEYSQNALAAEMRRRGLRTKKGALVSKNTLAGILTNPFYFGLIRIRKGDKSFAGQHKPIVTKDLFYKVQEILHGKAVRTRPDRMPFMYSRLIRCERCQRSLIAEAQKGLIYYRCHSFACRGTSFREEAINDVLAEQFARLRLTYDEVEILDTFVDTLTADAHSIWQTELSTAEARLAEIHLRLDRLMDMMLDSRIETVMFDQKKKALLSERLEMEHRIDELRANHSAAIDHLLEFVELVKSAYLVYQNGDVTQKRLLVRKTMSNLSVKGKTMRFTLRSELSAIAKRDSDRSGEPLALRCRRREKRLRQQATSFWKRWLDRIAASVL